MAAKSGKVRVGADIPEELHEKIKEYNKDASHPINLSKVILEALEAEFGKTNVMLAQKYPMTTNDMQGIVIKRDTRGMKVIDNDIFQDLFDYWGEQGGNGEIVFKLFLSELSVYGYRLDRGLLMLTVEDINVAENEIRFDCVYPINSSCRIDPNTGADIFLYDDDGGIDKNFFVSVVPFDGRKKEEK